MQAIFILTALVGLVYFLGARRAFDFYSLAFLSSLVYFIPGFAGFDGFGTPLDPSTYVVFTTVLLAVLAAAVLQGSAPAPLPVQGSFAGPALVLGTAVVVVLFVLVVYGIDSLLVHKTDSGIPGGVYIMWRVTSSLTVLYGVLGRRRWVTWTGGVLLMLTFVASDRTALALTLFALVVHLLGARGRVRAISAARRLALPVLVGAVLVWTGKIVHAMINQAYQSDSVSAVQNVLDNPIATQMLFQRTEPFETQAILNETIRQKLRIGPEHLREVIYQLWPVPSSFGVSSTSFNDIVQAELFPDMRRHSMAYNFWAEALATGGWLLLGVYVMGYVGGLALFNRLARTRNTGWRGVMLLMGAYWAFYIHRNSLASIVAYEKFTLYIAGVLLLLAAAWASRSHSRGRFRQPVRAPRRQPLPQPAPAAPSTPAPC